MSGVKVAILGWGSLIWDIQPDFDSQVGAWNNNGPVLPVEFCRISDSRKGALTLVTDRKLGTKVKTFYALSRQRNPYDAICDLRSRERTIIEKIGCINLITGEEQSQDPEIAKIIKDWAKRESIQITVWTDLESNFRKKKNTDFSFNSALNHLENLSLEGIREAVKYIVRTPPQVNTDLRQRLATNEWFKAQEALLENNG